MDALAVMVADAYLLIFAMLGLGLVSRRFVASPERVADFLNTFILYVCLPAAILGVVPGLVLDASALAVVAVPWLLLLATLLLVTLTTRLLSLRRDEHAVLLLTVGLGNTSFLGYPLVHALLGAAALPHAVLYDQLGAFLILSTFGLYVLARYGGDREPSLRDILGRIVRFPPFIALLVGMTLMPTDPPPWLVNMLQWLSSALLPLVMLAIGLTLRLEVPRDEVKPLVAGLALKLAVIPALSLGLAWLLNLQGTKHDVVVLESAMPPMITAAALAISHRLAPGLAAAMVAYGILMSLLTVPLWAWLLRLH